jgi:hypothetical protein
MANAITDRSKAWRRYLAAIQVYHFDSAVSIVFLDRAVQLGYNEAIQEKEKIRIHREQERSRILLRSMNLPYDKDISYDENIRIALRLDASIWDKVYISEEIRNESKSKTHKMLSGLGAWN